MGPLPDRAELIDVLDSMLDSWRRRQKPDVSAGGRDVIGDTASKRSTKAPAVYSIGVIDYQMLHEVDPGGAEGLVGEVTTRLDRLVRSGDLLGCVPPDQFLLAAHEMEPSSAGSVMDRIRGALAMPVDIAGGPVSLTVAIGVAFAFDDEAGDQMVRDAELDMQRVMARFKDGR